MKKKIFKVGAANMLAPGFTTVLLSYSRCRLEFFVWRKNVKAKKQ